MSERPLIGLVGVAGAGKDETARLLENYGYRRVAWASALKGEVFRALRTIGVLDDIDEGRGMKAFRQAWLEYIDTHKRDPNHWVRPLLQWWGTDFRRRFFGDDYWVKQLVLEPGMAVADTRFPNEAEAIRQAGGVIVKVVRPGPATPWWQRALTWLRRFFSLDRSSAHASERLVDSIVQDYTIVNDGTLAELGWKVEELVRWLESREEAA